MTAHEAQGSQHAADAPTRKPAPATPMTPMSELLASCAAAAAVSNPPDAVPRLPEELSLPAQRPERGAA